MFSYISAVYLNIYFVCVDGVGDGDRGSLVPDRCKSNKRIVTPKAEIQQFFHIDIRGEEHKFFSPTSTQAKNPPWP